MVQLAVDGLVGFSDVPVRTSKMPALSVVIWIGISGTLSDTALMASL
jgi:hypothetical protein